MVKDPEGESERNVAEAILNTLVINQEITDNELYLNIVKMTIMWTQGSFNSFLLSA